MGTSLGTDCPQMALLRGEAFSLPFHQRHFSLANKVVLGTKPSRNTPCKELSWVQPAMDPASFHRQHRGVTPSHPPLSEGARVAKTSRHPPEPAAKRKDKSAQTGTSSQKFINWVNSELVQVLTALFVHYHCGGKCIRQQKMKMKMLILPRT